MILLKEDFDFSVVPQIQKDLSSIWGISCGGFREKLSLVIWL